jgi:Outer membrane protein beta-barrel domain
MRPLLLLLLIPISVFAQPFSAGLKVGVPFTDFTNAVQSGGFDYTSPTQHYVIGGMAELHLPLGFGVEFDALYRSFQYNETATIVDVITTTHTSGSEWEFPLVLKYRFHFPVVRPYVEGGVAWNTLTGLSQAITSAGATITNSTPAELKNKTTTGIVLGGGIDIHAIFLHISPELRYTRWTSEQISGLNGLLHSNENQAEFLVGITF